MAPECLKQFFFIFLYFFSLFLHYFLFFSIFFLIFFLFFSGGKIAWHFLRRDHANLLCIVPIVVYVLPKYHVYNYACDMIVVRLLKQHGFRNSSTQLQKKLTEQHKEQSLQYTAHYLQVVRHSWRLANNNWFWPQSLMRHHLFLPFQKQAAFLQFTAGMCCHGLRK